MAITIDGIGNRINGILMPARGECRVTMGSNVLKMSPYGGNIITINGRYEKIPSAGVTLAGTGTAADTAYDIYAYMDTNGVMQLERSSNGSHSLSAVSGVEIKTGDETRTLVAKAATFTAGSWTVNSSYPGAYLYVINWFNRKQISARAGFDAPRAWGTSTFTELDGASRTYFLTWGDEVTVTAMGNVRNTVQAALHQTSIAVDTATGSGTFSTPITTGGAEYYGPIGIVYPATFNEGRHYTAILCSVNQGSGTWFVSNFTTVQA